MTRNPSDSSLPNVHGKWMDIQESPCLTSQTPGPKSNQEENTPISQLPTEILRYIFLQVRNEYYTKRSAMYMQWIVETTNICRHWRDIALDDCQLWSWLIFVAYRPPCLWMHEIIARSRGAPLYVVFEHTHNLDSASSRMGKIKDMLATHLPRIVGIEIHGRLPALSHFLKPPPTQNWAPLLETLIHSSADASDMLAGNGDAMGLLIEAPRLRYLRLSGYGFTWGSSTFKVEALIYLELTTGWGMTNPPAPTAKQLLDSLSRMVRLKELRLHIDFRSDVGNDLQSATTRKPLFFPELTHIALSKITASSGTHLMGQFTFPFTTSVHLSIEVLPTITDAEISAFFAAVRASWIGFPSATTGADPSSPWSTQASAANIHSWDTGFSFSCWWLLNDTYLTIPSYPALELNVSVPILTLTHGAQAMIPIHKFHKYLPFNSEQRHSLSFLHTAEVPIHALLSLPFVVSVGRLELRYGVDKEAVDGVIEFIDSSRTQTPNLPNLEELVILTTSFEDSRGMTLGGTIDIGLLAKALRSRVPRIGKLVVCNTGHPLQPEEWELLRGGVNELERVW